ncbi:MAG: hypothetical protein F7B20_01005 [Aeropyrum sp.]|nr:hypothetical protein [Aeropyrum sp.]
MNLLEFLIYAGGILLVAMSAYPLYAFALDVVEGAIVLDVVEAEDGVVIEIEYGSQIPLSDAKIIVEAGGFEYLGSDTLLEEGDVLSVTVPIDQAPNIRSITVSGYIGGLFELRVELDVSGEVLGYGRG